MHVSAFPIHSNVYCCILMRFGCILLGVQSPLPGQTIFRSLIFQSPFFRWQSPLPGRTIFRNLTFAGGSQGLAGGSQGPAATHGGRCLPLIPQDPVPSYIYIYIDLLFRRLIISLVKWITQARITIPKVNSIKAEWTWGLRRRVW